MPNLTLVKTELSIEVPDLSYVMKCQEEFNIAYEVPKDEKTKELYIKLIEEEHEEWVEDFYTEEAKWFDELKELADLLYVTAGYAYVAGYTIKKALTYDIEKAFEDSITDLVSFIATGDTKSSTLRNLIYCLYGYADTMGWDLDEAYRRVHISNMSKLGLDGKPVRREDGKVLKGPNYKPPYLEDLTNGE